jgi:hypothetical protein
VSRVQFTPADDREREIYEHYLSGSTRGDLYVHVKRGRMGILKPQRSNSNAYAAWSAGRDLEAQELAAIVKARGDQ